MLLERASGLATKIKHYHALKRATDEAGEVDTRAKQFGDASERLAHTRAALRRLAEAGITVAFKPSDAGLADKAKSLRTSVREDPASLRDPSFNLKHEFVDRLLGINTAADRAMTDAWKRYVGESSKLGSEDVLNALSALSQFRPSVAKIRHARASIEALASSLPADPAAAVARLAALLTEYRSAWAELSADGIPAIVVAFLRVCAAEGASIEEFTGEVRAWLEGRNLLNAFRIKIR